MTDELQERFRQLQYTGDGDWSEVLRRARKRRSRSRLALAAALAVFVALAAPTALALRGSITDFFESEPASRSMVLDFARMDVGAPQHLDNRVIYGQTRKIFEREIHGGQVLTLWVAPNRRGGFCEALVGPRHPGGFGCLWERSPLAPTVEVRGPITREGVINGGPVLIWGSVGIGGAETIELHYEDGAFDTQPLTWVSEPIDAAFFLFDITRPHWEKGHQYDRLIVRDGKGRELHSELLHRLPGLPR
jgi:hypothetical protein